MSKGFFTRQNLYAVSVHEGKVGSIYFVAGGKRARIRLSHPHGPEVDHEVAGVRWSIKQDSRTTPPYLYEEKEALTLYDSSWTHPSRGLPHFFGGVPEGFKKIPGIQVTAVTKTDIPQELIDDLYHTATIARLAIGEISGGPSRKQQQLIGYFNNQIDTLILNAGSYISQFLLKAELPRVMLPSVETQTDPLVVTAIETQTDPPIVTAIETQTDPPVVRTFAELETQTDAPPTTVALVPQRTAGRARTDLRQLRTPSPLPPPRQPPTRQPPPRQPLRQPPIVVHTGKRLVPGTSQLPPLPKK